MSEQVNFSTSGQQSPAANAEVITPADTDLVNVQFTRGIYVGGAGNLRVTMAGAEGDSDVTFSAVPAGAILPIRVKRIWATGTTATLIVSLF